MNASPTHQAVSQRGMRGLDDGRYRGRIGRAARLAPPGETPGVREGARGTNALVVAIDPVVPEGLAYAEVLVVAPALNSWLRHWLSDEDPARRRAEERLAVVVGELERALVRVEGRVGDADPLQAIADALATFPADEIVISARRKRSIEHVDELVLRASERFALPTSRAGEAHSVAA